MRLPIWNNVITTPQRWAAYWLRRRGWVCFYLDEQARQCGGSHEGCWLSLYQDGERRGKRTEDYDDPRLWAFGNEKDVE